MPELNPEPPKQSSENRGWSFRRLIEDRQDWTGPRAILPVPLCYKVLEIYSWAAAFLIVAFAASVSNQRAAQIQAEPALLAFALLGLVQFAIAAFRGLPFTARFVVMATSTMGGALVSSLTVGIGPNWSLAVTIFLSAVTLFYGIRVGLMYLAGSIAVFAVVAWGWVHGSLPLLLSANDAASLLDIHSGRAWLRILFGTGIIIAVMLFVGRHVLGSLNGALEDAKRALARLAVEQEKSARVMQALSVSEEQFRMAFDVTGLGMALVGVDGRWLRVNRRLCEIVGYSEQEMLEMTLQQLITPEDIAPYEEGVSSLLQGRAAHFQMEKRFLRREGQTVWVHLTGALVRGGAGNPLHFVFQIEDVTVRRQLEANLAQARDEAVQASRLKSEFLAMMSHEVRTPMNGILGMASLLMETKLTADQQTMVGVVESSAESLMAIINDILDFSKIEAGKLRLDIADFDLKNVVDETLALLGPRIAEKKLNLISDFDPSLRRALRGDKGRIRQVLTNLLGNAVKFTEQGEVSVLVYRVRTSGKHTAFRVTVRDTGIGISDEEMGRLFQPFSQGSSSESRRFGGSGLGLAICRQLVELMGGKIGCEKAPGRGAIFWFELELEEGTSQLEPAPGPLPPDLRVLAVDDSAANRWMILEQLVRLGVRAEAAVDGPSALVRLRSQAGAGRPFQVALLDRDMPDMDGLDLAKEIRADPLISATPLVMLSSAGTLDDPAAAAMAEFAEFLVKPARQQQLGLALQRAIGWKPQHRAADSPDLPPTSERLRLLYAEDDETNQVVARMQFESLGYSVTVACNGYEAIVKLSQESFDAIFMDCEMPMMDGYAATRHIRSGAVPGLNPRIPIIALTAYALPGDRERCVSAGMDDFLAKPVRPREIRDALVRCGLVKAVAVMGTSQ